jgi:hypothetical protein
MDCRIGGQVVCLSVGLLACTQVLSSFMESDILGQNLVDHAMTRIMTADVGPDGMKWLCRRCLWLTPFFLLTVLPLGCSSAPHMEPVQVQRVASYRLTAEQAGLCVAVDPYFETSRLKVHFGTDLLARKVLPVLVILENRDADGGFAILPDLCALLTKSATIGPGSTDPFAIREKAEARQRSAYLGLVGIISPLAGMATASISESAQEEYYDARDMQMNMNGLALAVKSVYRGDLNSGFLYFSTKGLYTRNTDLAMQVVAENIRTGEQIVFKLKLKP